MSSLPGTSAIVGIAVVALGVAAAVAALALLRRKKWLARPDAVAWVVHVGMTALAVLLALYSRNVPQEHNLYAAMESAFLRAPLTSHGKEFRRISSWNDTWEWIEGPLRTGLFESDLDNSGSIMLNNRLVGALRLRQLRVRADECKQMSSASDHPPRRPTSRKVADPCYPSYSFGRESEAANFAGCSHAGLGALPACRTVDGFSWSDSGDDDTLNLFVGALALYDSSGFVRDIKPDAATRELHNRTFAEAVAELKQHLWLDSRTRAAVVSFSVHNPSANLFASLTFMVELSQAGHFVPWTRIQPLRLDHPWDSALRAGPWFDTGMGALLVYRLAQIRRGARPPKASLCAWLLAELLVVAPVLAALIIRLAYWLNPGRNSWPSDTVEYVELAPAAWMWQTMVTVDAFAILGCAMGAVAMYLRDNSRATHPTAPALRRAGFPLLVLALVVAAFVTAYTIGAHQLAGVQQADLSSVAVGLATFARVTPSLARPSRAPGRWYHTATGLLLLWSYLFFGFLLLVMAIFILREHVRAAIEESKQCKARHDAAARSMHSWAGTGEGEAAAHDAPPAAESSPDEELFSGSSDGSECESDDEGEGDGAERHGPSTSDEEAEGRDNRSH